MTATYELRVKDRNLDIPIIGGNGRHTGFELVIKDGDNIVFNGTEFTAIFLISCMPQKLTSHCYFYVYKSFFNR